MRIYRALRDLWDALWTRIGGRNHWSRHEQ